MNLNIEGTKGAKIANLSKLFTRGSSKDAKKNMLMQCKVRVKGIIDILLSGCRVNEDVVGVGNKGIPRKLCEFFAKYFVSDGIAFPDGYLWLSEENKLEFAKVGTERVTRRMVFREDALEDSMKSQPELSLIHI